MTKITRATHRNDYIIDVEFSDRTNGSFDLAPLLRRNTVLTQALEEREYFGRFFLELGALCWPNGLELSAESIRRTLEERGLLCERADVA